MISDKITSEKVVRSGEKGLILIVALWSLCLLVSFAVILGYQVRQRLILVKRLEERNKLHYIAQAGVSRAIVELKKEPVKTYDTLKDSWSNNISVFRNAAVGDGTFDVYYDYSSGSSLDLTRRYGMSDAESKININTADLKVLTRLFRIVLGINEIEAEGLSAAIIDWRDSDSETIVAEKSAEDSFYRIGDNPYEAKDAAFEVMDELLLVRGFSENSFEKIKEYITIYGSGLVNINTASRPVLISLGLTENMADNIIALRVGKDETIGTVDDSFFENASDIVPRLSQAYNLPNDQIALLSSVAAQVLTVRSKIFKIKSIARLNGRRDMVQIDCIVTRTGRILSYREG